jgi:hypothetical protein
VTEDFALLRVLARDGGGARTAWAMLVAVLGHGALLALAFEQAPGALALVETTEIELLPPPELGPKPAPQLEPEPPPPPPARPPAAVRPARARPAPAPAPAPARAGALRTADEAAKTSGDPVRFVTDPNGAGFGFGAVARGGTADSAPVTAAPAAPVASQGSSARILSRPPRLAESDPCRGFFPARAGVDRGEVALRVRVERDGAVRSIAISREAPLGHGFGFAARDCLLSKRFSPALDREGHEVAVVSPVTVRFSR